MNQNCSYHHDLSRVLFVTATLTMAEEVPMKFSRVPQMFIIVENVVTVGAWMMVKKAKMMEILK